MTLCTHHFWDFVQYLLPLAHYLIGMFYCDVKLKFKAESLISAGIKPLFSSLSLWEMVCMRMVWCKLTDFVSWALLLGNTSVSDLLSCIRVWNHWSLKQRHCLLGNTYSSSRSDGNWIWNVYCNFKELWKRKSTHSYVTHAFIRCSGGGSGRRGGVQVIRRWYRTSADRRRGADSQPSVCVRHWFYSGASGHPLPKTGHARGAAHGGQSFYMRKWREVVSQCDIVKMILYLWMYFRCLSRRRSVYRLWCVLS